VGGFEEIRPLRREGRASVLPEWAEFYFKWWGIYTQGDGAGVTGGTGGDRQSHRILHDAHRHSQRHCDCARSCARSALWRGIMRAIWPTLRRGRRSSCTGLRSIRCPPRRGAGCGRSLAARSLRRRGAQCDRLPAGRLDGHELIDASPLARAVAREVNGNSEFYNLPRKFKITVTGCPVWCSYPEINDIALTAVKRGEEIGYSVRVGGGLSADPHLAVKLDAFVHEDQAVAVVRGIVEIFREQQGLRESRDRARLKHLFLREGWTAERFLEELQREARFSRWPRASTMQCRTMSFRDHVGVRPQKQAGLYSVGATVLNGRMSGEQLLAIADLSEKYAGAEFRTTVMQNFMMPHVPQANLDVVLETLKRRWA
jgi:sulfite reductase (ferredoxin)